MGFVKILTSKTNVLSYGIFKNIEIDLADKLNWQITSNIIILFIVIVSNSQNFINKLISCTVPINFSDNQEEYVNELCFIVDKYYAKDNERILILKNDSNNLMINYIDNNNNEEPTRTSYYIFVPIVLVIEAILVITPRYLWLAIIARYSKMDLEEMFKAVNVCREFSNKKFKEIFLKKKMPTTVSEEVFYLNYMINQFQSYFLDKFDTRKRLTNKWRIFISKRKMSLCYLFIKFLSILNVLFLVFVLNEILGVKLHSVMFKYFSNIFIRNNNSTANELDNEEFQSFYYMNSKYFPVRSTCTFKIRELALTNTYAVTCSLPINLFNQYIFIIILIWYLILINFNIYYLIIWIYCFTYYSEIDYAKENLILGMKLMRQSVINSKCSKKCKFYSDENDMLKEHFECENCKMHLYKFFTNFLDSDSLFLFKIISLNSDDALIQKFLVYFYETYQKIELFI
jgi:innexin